MNWTDWLAPTAAGAFLGVVIKGLLDLWDGRLQHRRELQRRFFDAKLEKTLAAVTFLKSVSGVVRSMGRDLEQAIARAEPISRGPHLSSNDLAKFSALCRDIQLTDGTTSKLLLRLAESEYSVPATLAFFYGSRWKTADESTETTIYQLTEAVTVLSNDIANVVGELQRAQEMLAILPELATSIGKTTDDLKGLLPLAKRLDELSDSAVEMMRRDFKAIAI